MVSIKERTAHPRVVNLNRNLPVLNWSDRVNTISDALHQWNERMEFWKHEFSSFKRIVALQFNDKRKYDQLLAQKFQPLEESMEEEFLMLNRSLKNFKHCMLRAQVGKVPMERCLKQWIKLDKRLADFERDYNWNKRNFLNLLSRSMPVKIY